MIIRDDFDYRSQLEARRQQYLNYNEVNLLPICNENRFSSIVNRALNKKAPFLGAKGSSDKGFKDAVIWESILEYALKNKGDYIFISDDKGFKEELILEFRQVTGLQIEILNKAELRLLDEKVEALSTEQNFKSRWQAINRALLEEGLFNEFLKFLENKELKNIEVNGIKCKVYKLDFNEEIIDLNEVGVDTYKFKLKGNLHVNLFAIPIMFVMDILIAVDSQNFKILSMELDSIEGNLFSGDSLSIIINRFCYNPGETDNIEKISEKDFKSNSVSETTEEVNKGYVKTPTVENNEIYQKFTKSYLSILSNYKVNYPNEFVSELINVLNNNATVDWVKFESKISRMKLSVKNFLKSKGIESAVIEKIVESIVLQAIQDYERFYETLIAPV